MKTNSFLPLALVLLAGCSSKKDDAPITCDDSAKVDGVCPGVTSDAVGTDGVACSSQISVSSSSELATKAASAPSGSCIVLAPGNYDAVVLPAGVSLLGQGSSGTHVAGVTTTGGEGATLRGISVGGSGIVSTGKGKGGLIIDRVLVSHSTDHGINVADANLVVTQTTVESSAKFGIAFSSSCTSACTDTPQLVLSSVYVREAHVVGIWAHGAAVHMNGVEVDTTHSQDFLYGRGLEVAADVGQTCSLDLTAFAALHGDEVGIYVDGCSAKLQHFTASDNIRGVQLQNIAGGATVSDFKLESNKALGLGVAKSKGIIVQGGRIASTIALRVPVDIGGVQEVGDGINWLESDVSVDATVNITNSARQGVIIDNTSTGTFNGTLSGGDETKGIIVQGGLVASVQPGLNVNGAVKTDVLTRDHAVPVADRVVKKKKD